MKTFVFSFFTICFLSNLNACETGEIAFPKNNLCAKLEWIKGPSFNQYNSISVILSDVTALKLNVLPWMVMGAGHEHGSRPVVITAQSNRDYFVEKIYFMGGMMGEWYLKFQLLNDQKEVIEESQSLIEL